jgi:hypothetical protein
MTTDVRIEGLEKLLKKLGDGLPKAPVRRFFKRAATRQEGAAKRRAPVLHGRMRNTITHEIDKADPPLWAKVGTAVTAQGKPYWLMLDAGHAEPKAARPYDYHYRSGGAMGLSGQPTAGWFSEHAVEDAREDIRGYFDDMRREIQEELRDNE